MKEIEPTKRQKKTEEAKKKLRDAMEHIMEKYDYNTVTIRNICSIAGVSYGSFYNLFPTKEDFLRYYLTFDFVEYQQRYYRQHTEFQALTALEKSIDIFVCCAEYNVYKGIKFIQGFYSPLNTSLFPDDQTKEYSFTPLLEEAVRYLEQAEKEQQLVTDIEAAKIANMYCYIFNGITFNWCISQGRIDMQGLTKKLLTRYLEHLQGKTDH